ncbi:glutathione S-transferase C-terminal domain-containing protein [Kitasatospora sp. NPDC004240]
MPELFVPASDPASRTPQPDPCHPAEPVPDHAHRFRGRIGARRGGGFYPASQRYRVYLCPGCPDSLRVAITLDLLDLRDTVSVVHLATPEAHRELRLAYETALHHYEGPLTVPALCDRWSGRIVSNHTPDILRDLAEHLADRTRDDLPDLRPADLAEAVDAIAELLAEAVPEAAGWREGAPEQLSQALDLVDRRLAADPYVLGARPTAADVDLWVALVELDTVHRPRMDPAEAAAVADRHRLWAYVRRLHRLPAFHRNLPAEFLTSPRRRFGRCLDLDEIPDGPAAPVDRASHAA